MDIRCTPAPLSGTIGAISSKSDAHRLLICAALSDKPTAIHCNVMSKDIAATADCIKNMGAGVTEENGIIRVTPSAFKSNIMLDCGESGSTLRFLLPVLSALGISATVTGHGRLPERPLSPLKEQMELHGAVFENGSAFPLRLSGRLIAGKYELAGNVSSQFVSGLLFALPMLRGDSKIKLIPPVESRSYLNITLNVLQRFGIEIEEKENLYIIKGNQKYVSPGDVTADGDWSNGAFFLSAGALSEKGVTVTGLNVNSPQGDRKIVDVLMNMGAEVILAEDAITVKKGELHGIDIDASDIPDLVPVISALAAYCEGTTRISGAGRLRIKECDRLSAMTEMLRKMNIDVIEAPDGMVIKGGAVTGGAADGCNDHRIVMSAAVMSCKSENYIDIAGAAAADKSYPQFFEDFNSLGGICNVINDGK